MLGAEPLELALHEHSEASSIHGAAMLAQPVAEKKKVANSTRLESRLTERVGPTAAETGNSARVGPQTTLPARSNTYSPGQQIPATAGSRLD